MNMHRILSLVLVGGLGVVSATSALAQIVRGYSGAQIFSTYGGDKDNGEPDHCGEPGGASAWFVYQAPANGPLVMDTRGSTFDTVLAVYNGSGADLAALESVACNNNVSETQTWSQVFFMASAGNMYFIAVDGVDGASGTVKLNYMYAQPPALTSDPESRVVPVEGSLTLTANAVGSPEPEYQWTFNGEEIPGATSASLMIDNFQADWEGQYQVRVSNSQGSVTSDPASVYAAGPLRIVQCQAVAAGYFRLRVVGEQNETYIIQCSSNLVVWTPIATNILPNGIWDYDDHPPSDAPHRYYRAVPGP